MANNAAESISLPTNETERKKLAQSVYGHTFRKLNETRDENGLSDLEYLILENMSRTTSKPVDELKEIALGVRNLEANPALAQHRDFPYLHRQAKEIVLKELEERMHDPGVQAAYLIELVVNKAKKRLEKNYEAVESRIGKDKAINYAACLLELELLQTEPVINEPAFKENLLNSLETGEPAQLVHIKSLRYTYPQDGGLEMIQDTGEFESIGLNGERRRYASEEIIFDRLAEIRKILEFYGIKSELTVIAADHDLDFLFPEGNTIIKPEIYKRAVEAAQKYIDYLKRTRPEAKQIISLSDFLAESGSLPAFEETYQGMVRQAKRGEMELVSEKVYEAHVNHQFEHYREMFGSSYTRDLARQTAMHRVADLVSLHAVFETFSVPPIVIIDGRGFETKLIGAKNPNSRSIFLTKLKDPVQVVQ